MACEEEVGEVAGYIHVHAAPQSLDGKEREGYEDGAVKVFEVVGHCLESGDSGGVWGLESVVEEEEV